MCMNLKHLHTLVTTVSNSDLGLESLIYRAIGIIFKFGYQCTNFKFELYWVELFADIGCTNCGRPTYKPNYR